MMTWLHLDKSCLWTHKIFCKASTRILITEQEASKSPLSKKCITNTTIDKFLLYYLYTSTDHFRPLDNWRTVARAAWYKLLAPATDPSSLSAYQHPEQWTVSSPAEYKHNWPCCLVGCCRCWRMQSLVTVNTLVTHRVQLQTSNTNICFLGGN